MNISQSEGLSEERQLMKWLGKIQMRIFWVAIFRVDFPGRSLMGGNFSGGIPLGGIFIEPSSSYKASILIFQKVLNKYNLTFNKDLYFKLIKYCAKFLSRNFFFQWARNIFNLKHVKQWKLWSYCGQVTFMFEVTLLAIFFKSFWNG